MAEITWMVGGPAGYGINASGEMFSRCFTRGGLNVFAYLEYPSLIRGGHNSYHIRVSDEPLFSQIKRIDLLVCLNKETFALHYENMSKNGGIIFDPEDFPIDIPNLGKENLMLFPVPLMKIVKDHEGIEIMRNTVALGASLALFDYPFNHLKDLICKQFKHKNEKIINLNVAMAKNGYNYIKNNFEVSQFPHKIALPENKEAQILLSGNEALSYGAMAAGCKFYCAYPMTPVSSMLTIFAKHEEEMNIVVKQPEDELAAILYAIGAGYTGIRALVATSGGGFALMNEALSLAGMIEVPLVVVEGQRPGPATGLPTWTGQADLQFLLHSGHDEFPKMIIAPGDVKEAYLYIQHAFNFAERYHLPVLVVSDKYLSEGLYSAPNFDDCKINIDRGPVVTEAELKNREGITEDYPRYQITTSGVSPRSLPGMKNARYIANSNEHDELGDIDESSEIRAKIHAKRLRKLETLAIELPDPVIYGQEKATISLIAWGSTKGPILEAMRWLEEEGVAINFIHPIFLHPFPTRAIKSFLTKAKKTLLIEGNYTAQLGQIIRQHTLMEPDYQLLKWDGRPFYPEEIYEKVKSLLT